MITASHRTLKDLLNSNNGVHLSVYVQNHDSDQSFRKRLNQLVKSAESHLKEVFESEDLQLFLKPIREFAANPFHLQRKKGSLAFFVKKDFFKIVHIPSIIDEISVTADSFHIKPLIHWAQQDHEFILVGVNADAVHFYKGTATELSKIDMITTPKKDKAEFDFTIKWLGNWIHYLTKKTQTFVFVIGDKKTCRAIEKSMSSRDSMPYMIQTGFREDKLSQQIDKIRSLVRLSAQTKVNTTLKEFDIQLKLNSAKTNIFTIAKAAVKGRIRKLVVAKDYLIFGRMDKLNGGLALHPKEMDHEDDCLLDDIAQTVLKNGGEVTVVKRLDIPKQRPILALLYEGSEANLDLHQKNSIAL